MRSLVITNCSNRKRSRRLPVRFACDPDATSLNSAAVKWGRTLANAAHTQAVSALYGGRAFSEARFVRTLLGADLFVVSAGLGLVHESDTAPNYDLTIADESSPLAELLRSEGLGPTDWWRQLGTVGVGRGSLASVIRDNEGGLTLIAMPTTYLEMVAPEVESMPERERAGLRIFSSPAGVASLPAVLKHCALPYDERLESVVGFAGTRSDFPQRAMRHFVQRVGGHQIALDAAREAVAKSLRGLDCRAIPARTRLSDHEIEQLLRRNWVAHKGSSGRLLAFLRREAKVACEQSRFRDIWRGLRDELAAEGNSG